LKKSGNEITEEVYRAGNDMLPAGLYAQELMSVVDNIRLAENYSREAKELLETLAQYFETGQTEFFSDYQKQWIRRDSTVDWSLGFFHADFDPRGIKGAFQGMVFIKNDEEQKLIDNLMLKIPELELESPCDPSFKQSEFPEIKIIAVDIITATGDAGYRIPEVVNFPDSEGFNLSGGKIVIFANVIEARWDLEFKRNLLFASNEEEMVLAQQYAREARTVFTILTETFGRLTAKSALGSQNKLGYLLPVVEEGIAQLSALWQLQNPKLCDWGIISNPEVALEGYQWWIREVMVNTVVHDDIGINEIAKSLAQRMIFNYLLARSQCLTLKSANGNTIYVLQDAEEMRRTVGELLQEMVRIRAEGDFLGASSLLKQYGTLFDASLIRELFQKILEAKLPLTIAVLTPEIKLVTTKMGKIKEVTIEYPEDVLKYGSDIAKRSFIVPETQKLENEILQRIEINE
jgi:dipeptidyl-peptidase-3